MFWKIPQAKEKFIPDRNRALHKSIKIKKYKSKLAKNIIFLNIWIFCKDTWLIKIITMFWVSVTYKSKSYGNHKMKHEKIDPEVQNSENLKLYMKWVLSLGGRQGVLY